MKILVTGGAGYIGSHTVVELINAGYEPVIVDNFCNSHEEVIRRITSITGKEIVCHEGDCCYPEFMSRIFEAEGNIGGVIHFAALKAVGESMVKPDLYRRNNIGSLEIVMEMMERFNVPLLVFSSSACGYGAADTLPVTEETPLKQPESVYGETKQRCEEIIEQAVGAGRPFRAVSLRYFNPIGAHDSALIGELPIGVPNNLVPFITQTAAGNLPHLTVFGNDYNTPDGTAIRDYIHVTDLAQAHVDALDYLRTKDEGGRIKDEKIRNKEQETRIKDGGFDFTSSVILNPSSFYNVFNLGTGRGNSVLEVIRVFEEVSGIKLNYKIGPRRKGDVEALYANCDKVKKEMGWQAKLTLAEALRDAWNWQKRIDRGELINDHWRITMDSWRKTE
jgi:UDP-glucose 4-epimerase